MEKDKEELKAASGPDNNSANGIIICGGEQNGFEHAFNPDKVTSWNASAK